MLMGASGPFEEQFTSLYESFDEGDTVKVVSTEDSTGSVTTATYANGRVRRSTAPLQASYSIAIPMGRSR